MTDNLNREDVLDALTDKIVMSYDRKTLENIVWDLTVEELSQMSWTDLRMTAEDFGVDLDDLLSGDG
jgi:hypothetical protein